MINVAIVGANETAAKLQRFPTSLRAELRLAVESVAIKLTSKVKADKLSGQALKVRTGRLRRSINYKVTETATGAFAKVGTNVEYGRIHEYGGRIGKSGTMPQRSFLRSALTEMKTQIISELKGRVRVAAERVNR